jgi:hypothetical protein
MEEEARLERRQFITRVGWCRREVSRVALSLDPGEP